jgi:hypothetical protein
MLSHDEALVLYDVLTRDMRGEKTQPQDEVEEWVMDCLTGSLEIAVRDDVFAANYAMRVLDARARIATG